MPRKAYDIPHEERTPEVVKPGHWESPEAEARKIPPVVAPARGLYRIWMMFVTGGMFTVGISYLLMAGFAAQWLVGAVWGVTVSVVVTVPACLVLYEAYATTMKSEVAGAKAPLIRGQQGLATLVDYLSLRLHIPDSVDLDPDPESKPPSYVFGVHPHGIHAYGATALHFAGNDLARLFPRVWHRICGAVATVIFRVPGVREIMLANGYRDASRSTCEQVLDEGGSVVLVVGGEQESIRTRAGRDAVWFRKRKGFVRLAMRKGVKLVPTYSFGLVDVYDYSGALEELRLWVVSRFQVCIPIFWGAYGGPVPYERPVLTVVGDPIDVGQCDQPRPREVEEAYNRYIEALERLFEDHKAKAGYPESRKLIVERDPVMSEKDIIQAEKDFDAYLERKARKRETKKER